MPFDMINRELEQARIQIKIYQKIDKSKSAEIREYRIEEHDCCSSIWHRIKRVFKPFQNKACNRDYSE